MKLDPHQIAPSQDFLKPHTIAFIFDCIAKGNYKALPPNPIVRVDDKGRYVAVDGHNLLAAKAYLNEDVTAHIAYSRHDGLSDTTTENKARNQELLEKYETAILERDKVNKLGVKTFQDLIAKYPELFNSDKNK